MGLFDSLWGNTQAPTKQDIYNRYYSDYPELPYISNDRNVSEWLEKMQMFPKQNTIPKSIMKRYADDLLPGHVYMLYWLKRYTNKEVPAYFEYKYGIDFDKEKLFLEKNGYLENNKPTEKGKKAIQKHKTVIEKHSTKKIKNTPTNVKDQILAQKASLKRNGFSYYEYVACRNSCSKCKKLDGKVFPLSKLEPGINAPPMCDNCRCSITAHIK